MSSTFASKYGAGVYSPPLFYMLRPRCHQNIKTSKAKLCRKISILDDFKLLELLYNGGGLLVATTRNLPFAPLQNTCILI